MASPSSHPRRRPQKGTGARPPSLPGSPVPSLRKVDTFNAPSRRLSDMIDPVTDAAYIPKRSPTSSRALESLIAPRPHIAKFLSEFDDTLAGLINANLLDESEVLAVPELVLEHTGVDDCMDIDSKPVVADHHHTSDSGLGSSIETFASSIKSAGSAINSSYTAASTIDDDEVRALSDFAAKEIKLRILDPILKQKSLEAFHPLITDIPRRIGSKEIKNLRDLEKNLLLLAFESAPSAKSYQRFCEQTITCILATADHLPEVDQRTPSDRPFTNSYALDLIDQIRRYAQIMAETRARQEAGKPLDEKDYSPDEELTVEGGLSYDGKPAQLVRKKDGKTIPIASPDEVEAIEKTSPMKRSFSEEDSDGEDATRSMARRRKSDRPGDVVHRCKDCAKEFKRPCDLTKHEKTHLRPWKCPEPSCKYHVDGWPTEKECERHVNDRHNTAPMMYKCQFPPCTYTSKRESNCKQHMEKSHNYTYVRSKNNGRNKGSRTTPGSGAPSTPMTPFMNTPASALISTPDTPFAPSPALTNFDFNNYHQPTMQTNPMLPPFDFHQDRRQSTATTGSGMTGSSSRSPFDQSSFEDEFTSGQPMFTHNTNFDMINHGLPTSTTYGFQPVNYHQHPPTPAMSSHQSPLAFDQTLTLNTNFTEPVNTHLSPIGQADATLLSPTLVTTHFHVDEGFGEDFTLFNDSSTNALGDAAGASFFPDMDDFNRETGGQFYSDNNMNVDFFN